MTKATAAQDASEWNSVCTYIDNIRRIRAKSLFDRYAQILQIDGILFSVIRSRLKYNKTVFMFCCAIVCVIFFFLAWVYVCLYHSVRPLPAHIHKHICEDTWTRKHSLSFYLNEKKKLSRKRGTVRLLFVNHFLNFRCVHCSFDCFQ